MTRHQNIFNTLFFGLLTTVALFGMTCFCHPCFAEIETDNSAIATTEQTAATTDAVDAASEDAAPPLTGFRGWLGTYNKTLGMCNASIFTTIFGGAFVAFFISVCWGKLVELYGALGGLIGGGAIVGTFWVLNHKLPGVGIAPGGVPHADGFGSYQFGLIVQAFHSTGPWIDMSLAVCVGLFTATFLECLRAKKRDASLPGGGALIADAFPRAVSVILGGIVGGIIVGLIGFTGAQI